MIRDDCGKSKQKKMVPVEDMQAYKLTQPSKLLFAAVVQIKE